MDPAIYAIATLDTKGSELDYLADCIRRSGVVVRTVDVGTLSDPSIVPDVSRQTLLADLDFPADADRGAAVTAMGEALRRWLSKECEQNRVSGVVGLGGSGGTALICNALRQLPIGLPKFMVSTVASGNVAPYVGCSDICMLYSVVDIAGLNVVTRRILANAAHAVVGMVVHQRRVQQPQRDAPRDHRTLGMTMFGVTTPCVTAVRTHLEAEGHDCLVFHATGTGGSALEQLVDSGMIDGVLDLTTTEVADRLVGGIMPAGEHRLEAALKKELPLVISVGAVDMVNFGAIDTVPSKFKNRALHLHNPQITLMRTTPEENRQIGRWIAEKLNRSTSPLVLLIPEGGVSALDAPGQPFYDPQADQALFTELESVLQVTERRRVKRLPYHINEPAFAQAVVDEFNKLL